MQKYKHLIWVLVISIVVGAIVLWAVYTPTNHQLSSEAKKYLPRPDKLVADDTKRIHVNPIQSQSTNHTGTSKTRPHDSQAGHHTRPQPNFIKFPVSTYTQDRPPKPTSQRYKDNRRPPKTAGYIITQTYGGQMTRAIRNLMLQQCWADSLITTSLKQSLYIVEPFSARSNLLHKPALWDALGHPDATNAAPRFSDYYDLNFYNEYSIHNHSTPLALWEDFIANAPRYAVVVVTPRSSCAGQLSANRQTSSSGTQLLRASCEWMKPFSTFVDGLAKWGFSVRRTICVTCDRLSHPITVQDLHDQIYQGRSISEVTVLVNSWRNYAFTGSWLEMPDYCKMGEDPTSSKRLIPSKLIINNTQYYKRNILKSVKVVAVMLRIERFLTLKATGRSEKSVSSCMSETLVLRNKIQSEYRELSDSGTFLTLDIGRFGSGIMQNEGVVKNFGQDSLESIRETVAKTVHDLYNGKYTIKTWEDTFVEASGGIEERGYIAMLQRNIATEADCLILMGGGSFQQVAAFQYIKNHPDPSTRCLHTVCVAESFSKSIGLS